MPMPLDAYLGHDMRPERREAVAAIVEFTPDANSHDFWEDVARVQEVCKISGVSAQAAAKALQIVKPFLVSVGSRGHEEIPDGSIAPLISKIAEALTN